MDAGWIWFTILLWISGEGMGGSRELGGYARERSLIKSTASHSPLFRASPVGLPSRSARFITSSSSTIAGSAPWASKALPAGSEDVTDNTSSSRSSLSSAAVEREMKKNHFFSLSNSFASFICDRPRTQSLHLPQQWLDPSRGGQMIAAILSRKRDNRERSFFPQKKGSQWTHSIPSRTERSCSSPKHITHRSRVWSSVRQRWHGSTHLLKRFSTDISTHTSETRSPEGKKRMMCSTGALLCSQMLVSLRHRRPPANARCIGCF